MNVGRGATESATSENDPSSGKKKKRLMRYNPQKCKVTKMDKSMATINRYYHIGGNKLQGRINKLDRTADIMPNSLLENHARRIIKRAAYVSVRVRNTF